MSDPIRYIILNGPPGSGKTTIALELVRNIRVILGDPDLVTSDSFAAPIKHFIAAALSEKYQIMDKERARPELNGFSVRGSLIDFAENYVKPVYGKDIFGRWLVHRSLKYPNKRPLYVVVDDGGFPEEVEAVPNRIVIRVTRAGKDFTGDSRGFVENYEYDLENVEPIAQTWVRTVNIARAICQ